MQTNLIARGAFLPRSVAVGDVLYAVVPVGDVTVACQPCGGGGGTEDDLCEHCGGAGRTFYMRFKTGEFHVAGIIHQLCGCDMLLDPQGRRAGLCDVTTSLVIAQITASRMTVESYPEWHSETTTMEEL